MKKRLMCTLPMIALISAVLPSCGSKTYDEEGVILYTNDVHCAVDYSEVDPISGNALSGNPQMGYSVVASLKKEKQIEYGQDNVYLVDNGDHLQGGVYGTLSNGLDIVNAMNAAHYDLAIPGNHEFDYGMDHFLDLANNYAEYEYISSNFVHEGKTVFNPYRIVEIAGRKVAFIGATTPDTYTSSTPKYFKDENGNYVYTFSEGDKRDGKTLYETLQKTIDKVRRKADLVVLMAHLGIDEVNSPYMSTDIIKNTSGIDVVLDGHSHSTLVKNKVKDKKGNQVILSSTGTKLENIGVLKLNKDGSFNTELVHHKSDQKDFEAKLRIDKIVDDVDKKTSEVFGTTKFPLTINDATNTSVRRVRKGETNMGDFAADAYQAAEGADFAFINGGGVRATIKAGNITLKDVLSVQTFNNVYETYKTKGLNIRNALENSVRDLPVRTEGGVDFAAKEANYGGYLQASKGIKFAVDTTIPSPVQKDAKNFFTGVEGKRRVHSVQVATTYNSDGEPTAWEALSDTKEYTFGCISYVVEENGDGHNEFKLGEDTTKVTEEYFLDYQIVSNYFTSFPKDGGVPKVPTKYQSAAGANRVTYSKNTSSN